jgi:hypothetical protein
MVSPGQAVIIDVPPLMVELVISGHCAKTWLLSFKTNKSAITINFFIEINLKLSLKDRD